MKRLAIVGTGNMGEALLRGLLQSKTFDKKHIVCTTRRESRCDELSEKYGVRVSRDNHEAVRTADVVMVALKPQLFQKVLPTLTQDIPKNALVISVAAGITIETISELLFPEVRVIRAMPNTPALVDAGATVLSRGEHASDEDLKLATAMFEAVGRVSVLDESLMNAVTGLSGSGPAYVFMMIEALADAGVRVGLPRYEAQALAAQTVLGSAKLLIDTGEHPGVLKDRVTSPGGTAIAGLHTLEKGGLRTTLINGVVAATERAEELGRKHAK